MQHKIFCEAKISTTQYCKQESQESCSLEQRLQFCLVCSATVLLVFCDTSLVKVSSQKRVNELRNVSLVGLSFGLTVDLPVWNYPERPTRVPQGLWRRKRCGTFLCSIAPRKKRSWKFFWIKVCSVGTLKSCTYLKLKHFLFLFGYYTCFPLCPLI